MLASRLLKATGRSDPLAVLHHAPGPEPLRRVVRAARRRGVAQEPVAAAEQAIGGFERLIRHDAGDRSALDAILCAWLPEARREFELRRKQAAYRAISQLRGASMDTNLSAVFLHPARSGRRLDVVWVNSFLGIERLRPGAALRFSSRRLVPGDGERRPTTLDGQPVEGLDRVRLDEFCVAPPAPVEAFRAGELVHYVLGGTGYGAASAVDLVFGEVNLEEMPRFVPRGAGRRGYVYADIAVPAKVLVFDVFVHADVWPGSEPELFVYDTAIGGIADVNDHARDIDRLDLAERVVPLGSGLEGVRLASVPRYEQLVAHVHRQLGWDAARFRGYRTRVEYPLYGSQVAVAFAAPEEPA